LTLDEGHSLLHLLFVAATYGKLRLWLWKCLEISGSFFSYFVAFSETWPVRKENMVALPGGNVTSAGWQVILCDPIWLVSSRSGEASR